MRHLLDFGLGATDLTVAIILVLRGWRFVPGFLAVVGGALMVATLGGAR